MPIIPEKNYFWRIDDVFSPSITSYKTFYYWWRKSWAFIGTGFFLKSLMQSVDTHLFFIDYIRVCNNFTCDQWIGNGVFIAHSSRQIDDIWLGAKVRLIGVCNYSRWYQNCSRTHYLLFQIRLMEAFQYNCVMKELIQTNYVGVLSGLWVEKSPFH